MSKYVKRSINGVLLLDKPQGMSSNTALQKVRHLYQAQKAGHTGVLDPLATGLLPICFGEATKFAQYLLDADKTYIATLKLGEATTTGDAEGEVIDTARADINLAEFQAACQSFIGQVRQVPPMFSALKHQGKPLYEYARQGVIIERKPRKITIQSINIIEFSAPQAMIQVHCSKGTYIRTLSEDIAKYCHTFAHLTALRRTATAGFNIEQSHSLSALNALSEVERDNLLLPCDVLVQHFPALTLNEPDIQMLQFGQQPIFSGDYPTDTPLRIYSQTGHFIGLVHYLSQQQRLKTVRLMNTVNKIA